MTAAAVSARTSRTLVRRLAPLLVAMGLQGMILWVPVEKLFMSEIGFTPASVGVMAAAYAAVVPLLEVPSGFSPTGGAAAGSWGWPVSRCWSARQSAGSATPSRRTWSRRWRWAATSR